MHLLNIIKISLMSWFHLKAGRGMTFTWDGAEQGKGLLLSDSPPYPREGWHSERLQTSKYLVFCVFWLHWMGGKAVC